MIPRPFCLLCQRSLYWWLAHNVVAIQLGRGSSVVITSVVSESTCYCGYWTYIMKVHAFLYVVRNIIWTYLHILPTYLYRKQPLHRGPHAPPPPPMIFHEWYHFLQWTPRNDIRDVARKNTGTDCPFRPFFKMGTSRKWKFQYLGLWNS